MDQKLFTPLDTESLLVQLDSYETEYIGEEPVHLVKRNRFTSTHNGSRDTRSHDCTVNQASEHEQQLT